MVPYWTPITAWHGLSLHADFQLASIRARRSMDRRYLQGDDASCWLGYKVVQCKTAALLMQMVPEWT